MSVKESEKKQPVTSLLFRINHKPAWKEIFISTSAKKSVRFCSSNRNLNKISKIQSRKKLQDKLSWSTEISARIKLKNLWTIQKQRPKCCRRRYTDRPAFKWKTQSVTSRTNSGTSKGSKLQWTNVWSFSMNYQPLCLPKVKK